MKPCKPWQAWLVHALTALGAVIALLSLVAVIDDHPDAAIGWLLLSLLIDGVDGTLARALRVAEVLPQVDGAVLDVIVDFVGCVVVPATFLWKFHMLPSLLTAPVLGFTVVTSALWFARTDLMSEDGWFNGFPAEWNLVVPTLFLLHVAPNLSGGLIVALAALQLTSVKFVHPMRVVEFRALTVAVTLMWLGGITTLAFGSSGGSIWTTAAIVGAAAYHTGLSIRRSRMGELPLTAAAG